MSATRNDFSELTITEYHARLRADEVSSEALVQWYLDRINSLDIGSEGLSSVVTVNPAALAEAARLDALLADTGEFAGPLHGVPVLVKDQAETAGLRTTFGSIAFDTYIPTTDATLISRLKNAGAIILAKTAMCDLAAGWFSSSSVTGRTRNPYDLQRDSGGSSAGSAVSVSANLGLVAVGEDTGGSIRIPASFTNLFGLRVTTGLISRFGFSPLVHFQDTAGPISRSVDDLAILLDELVGYDEKDPYTVAALSAREAGRYAESARTAPAIDAWRIGVLETGFGRDDDADSAPVTHVIEEAIARIGEHGTGVTRGLEIDGLSNWIAETSVYVKQSKIDVTRFLQKRPDAPVSSFMEIYEKNLFNPLNDLFHDIAAGPDDLDGDYEYLRLRLNQEAFRRLVLQLFADANVDFIVYPTVQVIPPTQDELEAGKYTALTFPTNTVIGSQAGLPAMTIPAGFTAAGLPIGLEVLGKPYREADLIQFAKAWETLAQTRRAASVV